MIRLVATDLDGTLLYPDGEMPEGIFDCIRELAERGIRFAAASGRPTGSVRQLFAPVADQIDFICENGALVIARGRQRAAYFPRPMAEEIIRDLQAAGLELFLSAPERCYGITNASAAFIDETVHRGFNISFIDDPLPGADGYIKITGFHVDAARVAPPLQQKWQGKVHCDIAGDHWLDFTLASKGSGIRTLAEALDIPLCEAAAFGDQFNDVSMLELVGHPYVMAHAPAPLLQMGFQPCEDVMDTLRAILRQANGGSSQC